MTKYLPLFPLGIVVYPGEKLNLHIFEPRYKQLIQECITNKTTFGIPSFLENGIGEYGTELKVLRVEKKYDNGEMDIKTQALGIFRVIKLDKQAPGRLYPGGEVQPQETDLSGDVFFRVEIEKLLRQLYEALHITSLLLSLPADFKSFDVAHHLGLSLEQEYLLLQTKSEADRQDFILQHLRAIVPVVHETERLKERVKMNGHFKNLTPPEL
ncbi:peptidase [Pontibacter qinzhouensis]|uniref:Peptidase n=1 Tax=Pontibacter qinzhouensis TaxID=2603253 RepID=A0A5C8K866_9BACT|nr:LON peptidase substrate-binding domain-containing protein [Pontibacter qinzhouensis]TXK46392.1 peptidase [Pontibacter qinzhouensis]